MVNGLIILFGLTMLYLSTTSRLKSHVNTLIIQGLLLFLICATEFEHHPWYTITYLTISFCEAYRIFNCFKVCWKTYFAVF